MDASDLGTLAIAVVMMVTGLLLLAYAARGLPQRPVTGIAQSDVVLVATKSKKKTEGNE